MVRYRLCAPLWKERQCHLQPVIKQQWTSATYKPKQYIHMVIAKLLNQDRKSTNLDIRVLIFWWRRGRGWQRCEWYKYALNQSTVKSHYKNFSWKHVPSSGSEYACRLQWAIEYQRLICVMAPLQICQQFHLPLTSNPPFYALCFWWICWFWHNGGRAVSRWTTSIPFDLIWLTIMPIV